MAVIDSTQRVFIGHDLFYFSDAAARQQFLRDPLRYAKRLTDPVTLARFTPTKRSHRRMFNGRDYWFATDSTYRAFAATPDSFAVRRGM